MLIPCHNEAISIASTVQNVRSQLSDVEIWVIDNGSTDKTREISENLGVQVLSCPTLGKGYAIRKAFSEIKGDYDVIFMVDGDDTYDLAGITQAFNLIISGGYDMVIGRRVPIGIEESDSESRTVHYRSGHQHGNKVLSKLFSTLFKIKIQDSLSGWRCFSPGYVRSFSGGASGFELETELNAHLFLIRGSVTSIDVGYRGRLAGSHSKLNTISDGVKILRRLLFLFRTERPLLAYSILGAPWFILSVTLMRNVLDSYYKFREIPNFPEFVITIQNISH